MEMDLGKLWVAGAGFLVGAIGGAWIWAQQAAAAASRVAEKAGEDALINVASGAGTTALAAALKGAAVGGVIGVLAAVAYLYFTDPDREMKIRKVDVNDRY